MLQTFNVFTNIQVALSAIFVNIFVKIFYFSVFFLKFLIYVADFAGFILQVALSCKLLYLRILFNTFSEHGISGVRGAAVKVDEMDV